MPKKKTVEELIEDLAQMVQHGFGETASKQDFRKLEGQIELLADQQDLMQADIADIKRTLGPLVSATVHMEGMLREHDKRIERLERKIGVGR